MNLIRTIKSNENIRKLFGKREIFLIEKQLRGMKLKPSEKTRLSRDIRKKFDAIKLLSPFINEFELKHGAETKRLIKNMKEHILESEYQPKIKKIYLFGSVVAKEHLFRSDIDIAVEFIKIEQKEATKFRIKFNYDNNIDVQVYNVLPEKIKREIDTKGKIIYERKN